MTKHDLQDAIVRQAVQIAQLEAWREGDAEAYGEQLTELVELRRERDALLAENASLRSEADGLAELIHELSDDRALMRWFLRSEKGYSNEFDRYREAVRRARMVMPAKTRREFDAQVRARIGENGR